MLVHKSNSYVNRRTHRKRTTISHGSMLWRSAQISVKRWTGSAVRRGGMKHTARVMTHQWYINMLSSDRLANWALNWLIYNVFVANSVSRSKHTKYTKTAKLETNKQKPNSQRHHPNKQKPNSRKHQTSRSQIKQSTLPKHPNSRNQIIIITQQVETKQSKTPKHQNRRNNIIVLFDYLVSSSLVFLTIQVSTCLVFWCC